MGKYWNNQKYSECHLVSIWNAAMFYGVTVPVRYGDEYITDCEKGYAINGSCINSSHVVEKMHLRAVKGRLCWNWIKVNCPIEFSVFCHRGYHSVLGVGINHKKKEVLLANYDRGRLRWMEVDKLIAIHNKNLHPVKWCQRRRLKDARMSKL